MKSPLLVAPGSTVLLDNWDANDTSWFPAGKEAAKGAFADLLSKMEPLQEVLYAEHTHRLLVILQAMDTGGKDGTVRKVFEGVNPQGVRVASFKEPSPLELDHDYLWRAHRQVPARGEIAIFNRSYYEDVLVVRVHRLAEEAVWRRRFDHINEFEKMLTDEGTTILKFFLHIDRDEQRSRLRERLENPDKQWKLSLADIEDRKLWSDYQVAYEEAIGRTSTAWAPWRIVPANHHWLRNLVVSSVVVSTLEEMKMRYPDPPDDLERVRID